MQPTSTIPASLRSAFDRIARDVEGAVADLARMLTLDTAFLGTSYAGFADLLEELLAPFALETRRVSVLGPLWHVPPAARRCGNE